MKNTKIIFLNLILILLFNSFLTSCNRRVDDNSEIVVQTITAVPSATEWIQATVSVEIPEQISSTETPFISLPCDPYLVRISTDNKKIAVDCDDMGSGEFTKIDNVWAKDTQNGNEWTALLPDDSTFHPLEYHFSPDDQYLAVTDYFDEVHSEGAIWVFRTSDWELYKILQIENAWYNNFVWTPDSKFLAVHSMEVSYNDDPSNVQVLLPGGDYVLLVGIDGEQSSLLLQHDVFPGRDEVGFYSTNYDIGPAWSPDEKYLAYLAMAPGDWINDIGWLNSLIPGFSSNLQLVLVDRETQSKEIVYEGILGEEPLWSPDGRKILFNTYADLQVFDLETREMTTIFELQQLFKEPINELTPVPRMRFHPLWLADSKYVLFNVIGGGDKSGYYIVAVEGGDFWEETIYGGIPIHVLANEQGIIWQKGNELYIKSIQ